MKEYIPYVYIVKNKTTKLKYIGVEYGKTRKIANPCNLWVSYFTSSKLVHHLIEMYGRDDFYVKVLHVFPNDPKAAILKEAHYFKFIKNRPDYLNLCYSSGVIDLRASSKGGMIGGRKAYMMKVGAHDPKNKKKYASIGGKAGAAAQIKNKIGIHGQTPEERKFYCSLGGKQAFINDPERHRQMSIRAGRIGGKGNLGFRWYNDGHKNFKYSAKNDTPFERFLELNPKFKKGRIYESKKNY